MISPDYQQNIHNTLMGKKERKKERNMKAENKGTCSSEQVERFSATTVAFTASESAVVR
jgi:hypothetical protein